MVNQSLQTATICRLQLVRFLNHHVTAVRTRHGAADQQQIVLGVDAHELSGSASCVCALPYWPAMPAPLSTRLGNALRPVPPACRCTFFTPCVARWPGKLCRTHDAGGAAALGGGRDVDRLDVGEGFDLDLAADGQFAGSTAELANESLRLAIGLGEQLDAGCRTLLGALAVELGDMTTLTATGQTAGLVEKAQLHRFVTVALLRCGAAARGRDRPRSPSPGSPCPLRRKSVSSRPCGRVFQLPSLCTLVQLPVGRQEHRLAYPPDFQIMCSLSVDVRL